MSRSFAFSSLTALAALGGACTNTQDLGNHGPPSQATDGGSTGTGDGTGTSPGGGGGADAGQGAVDAGPPVLYGTMQGASPTDFMAPTAVSYRGGYTVMTGQGIIDGTPPDTLPTVVDLSIRIPSAAGTVGCNPGGTVDVEVDESRDSNANLKQKSFAPGSGAGTCTIQVTQLDPPGGRIVGTFTVMTDLGVKITGGVFDLPRGPDQ